jgi:hypothetical protein
VPSDPKTVPPSQAAEAVRRARAYPFAAPRGSYVYCAGRALPLIDPTEPLGPEAAVWSQDGATPLGRALESVSADAGAALAAPRTAVLAYGSNPSVEALSLKFTASDATTLIPVIRAHLVDFDVVHSAHLSAARLPATLQRSAGTVVQSFVLYLTDEQIDRLHATESLGGNYEYRTLDGVALTLDSGVRLESVPAYVSLHGALRLDGQEIALAAIPARDRRFPSMTQVELQEEVRRRLGCVSSLDELMRQNATDTELATLRTRRLQADAAPLRWP